MDSDRQVLRNPLVIPMAVVVVPGCVVGGLLLQERSPGVAVGLWLGAAILLLSLRLSLTLTNEGVIVTNVLSRRYRWDEITRVSVERIASTQNPTGGRMLVLDLHNGKRKSAWAVSSGVYKPQWVDQAWAQVHQRWQLTSLGLPAP